MKRLTFIVGKAVESSPTIVTAPFPEEWDCPSAGKAIIIIGKTIKRVNILRSIISPSNFISFP
ncbi:MAG: hypothetical protein LUQ59_03130, partial [Methanothrix sp.]|nr:hypothetical protein [Methanothrix sp.]